MNKKIDIIDLCQVSWIILDMSSLSMEMNGEWCILYQFIKFQ